MLLLGSSNGSVPMLSLHRGVKKINLLRLAMHGLVDSRFYYRNKMQSLPIFLNVAILSQNIFEFNG